MDESVKVILKKLDDIDSRLKSIEGGKTSAVPTLRVSEAKIERDPLFGKALEMMDKFDEMSSPQLQEALKVDQKRADTILDQLETAGLGTCYMKEV
ncbi:MAG TPA: hypothetical protein VF385_01375 [Patescibacteria group bacterium]